MLSAAMGGRRSGGQSLVTIVESTNLWKGDDLACFGALDRSEDRAVLTQRQVSARAVVVVEMRCQNACTYSDQWVDHLVKQANDAEKLATIKAIKP